MTAKEPKGNFVVTKDDRQDLVDSGEWEKLPNNGDYNRYARLISGKTRSL
jgi:hypothetical protein